MTESSAVRAALNEWEQAEGLTPTEAAHRTNYSFSMYSSIKRGDRRPHTTRIVEFQEATGVPGSMFYPELRGFV